MTTPQLGGRSEGSGGASQWMWAKGATNRVRLQENADLRAIVRTVTAGVCHCAYSAQKPEGYDIVFVQLFAFPTVTNAEGFAASEKIGTLVKKALEVTPE